MGCEKELALNFVVAHSHEARPIIDYYKLSKANQYTGFNVFVNNQTRLIVSGQGKVNSAAATAYLAALSGAHTTAGFWINVGVAGHPDYDLASLWRVNKVTDEQSGRNFYPVSIKSLKSGQRPARNPVQIKGSAVLTVDAPTSTYEHACLYDMEAAGFFQAALHFVTLESVLSFKVVSDNRANPAKDREKKSLANFIQPHVEAIALYLQNLYTIKNFKKIDQDIDTKGIKLSYAQQKMVNELAYCLTVQGIPYQSVIHQSSNARQLIEALQVKLKCVEMMV